MILTDLPCMLSSANVTDTNYRNRSKMAGFFKYYRNQRVKGKYYILYD